MILKRPSSLLSKPNGIIGLTQLRIDPIFRLGLVLETGSFRLTTHEAITLRKIGGRPKPRGLRDRRHRKNALWGSFLITVLEVSVHRRTSGIGMNLDKQLIDHLTSKSFANPRKLTRGFLGARFARESYFGADPRIIFLTGKVHRRRHYAL